MPRFAYPIGGVAVLAVAGVIAMAAIFKVSHLSNFGAATAPAPTASPSHTFTPYACDYFPAGGAYGVTLGTIRATATVPNGWHGIRNFFKLSNSVCVDNGSVRLEISLVDEVYVDACDWQGARVDASTAAAVVHALTVQESQSWNGTSDTTLGGYPAKRFEISVPADFDTSACDEGGPIYLWPDAGAGGFHRVPMASGQKATVYVVDVGGSAIGVATVPWTEDATPAEIAELDAVVASLRFEP
ncbi:MAG TPA: hypothetical protein VMQ65_08480 [Candidatus Limnocylindria bacterium]|nr:hypothetical protein [Candidatus Limnocylindria bacterium]